MSPISDRSGGADALAAVTARYGLDTRATAQLRVLAKRLSSDEHAPTAVRDPALVLDRHIADSLAGLEVEPLRAAGTIADLGSGGGLPALVLAAALPAAQVLAVESHARKCAYIEGLAEAMELGNVRVVCARVEDWADGLGANEVVVARALAAQPVVLEYAAPLLVPDGHLVEWRGRRLEHEERESLAAAALLGLEREEVRHVVPFPGAEERHLHVFRKSAPTPERFPRRAGVASRRPLGS